MKPYTVQYKLKGAWFWRTLKNVVGDNKLDAHTREQNGAGAPWPTPTRVFFLDDDTRIELPMEGTTFRFSPERQKFIEASVNREAGQKIV